MLAKEFKTIGKQGLILLGIMLLLPGFVFIERIFVPTSPSYFDAFFIFFQIGALSWAFFMGISMFSNEKRQGGVEYLLTLPYSRYQLLALKAIPRILAVVVMFLAYLAVYHLGGIEVSLMGKVSFAAWYFTIFVLSLSLSTTSENFLRLSINLFVTFVLVAGLLYVLVIWTFRLRAGADMGISAMDLFMIGADKYGYLDFTVYSLLFLVLPFIVSFIVHFKRFDASYSRETRRGFYKVLIPALVVGILLSFFATYRGIDSPYSSFYLTSDLHLLEVDEFEGKLYDGENVRNIDGFNRFGYPFLEDDRYVFEFNFLKDAGMRYARIMRLDKKDLSVTAIYESMPNSIIGYRGWSWKNDIVFLEWGEKDYLNIVRVDRDNRRVRTIKVFWGNQKARYKPILLGADELNGREFYMVSVLDKPERSVVRIWEDGNVEPLNIKAKSPLYVNGMLLAPRLDGHLQFWNVNEVGAELVKEIRVDLRFYSHYWQSRLNLSGMTEVCGIMDRKLYRVDLNTLSVEVVSESASYPRQSVANEGIYYAELSAPYVVKSLNRYKDGKIQVLKEFNLDTLKRNNYLRIFKNGFILEQDGKIGVYSLPDMKELHFRHLN